MKDDVEMKRDGSEETGSPAPESSQTAGLAADEPAQSGSETQESSTSETDPQSLQGRISELEREVSGLQREAKEKWDRYLRLAADFDNFRRRVQKEREDISGRASEGLILKLLPVLDNLELALRNTGGDNDSRGASESLRAGLQMVVKQFRSVLESEGLKEVPGVGASFDPRYHEAVMQTEDEGEPGQILEVLRPGYVLGDKVLRAGLVRVAK